MDWLDELFDEAENTNEAELRTLQYIERLIHNSVYSQSDKYNLLNYVYSMEFDFKEVPEIIRRLGLDQKSAFDEDMPNKITDVAKLSQERKTIDDAKE